ncbi:methyltransferase domain-containing protein [Streptomyces subrutilus]|uniref:Class I SAM-dependent methyltransferase n=1 Tax=Streptomyces subrutilus TaxID=36818 RepID=A0A5P2UFW0_9ACTN|nr:class I SAM-dependent methyltransferase [Streptomyces subrutilus]QEU77850.1 class I SAM-dependent methyltransferase [Streptomyces subrutilus]WSJ33009.1 class I SAM-dependent methyltransferase [Streptomyces subrutilus]
MNPRQPHVDWDSLFGDDYDHFDLPDLTPELSAKEASDMVRLGGFEPGTTLLDAPCGHGRHANVLASRGYTVTGIDRDERFLSMAADEAREMGVDVEYHHVDLREMSFDAEFDGAVSWYSSFGYFDDETDRDILRRYRRALRPGGRFLLDMHSPYRHIPSVLANHEMHVDVLRRGADMAIDIQELDAVASRYYAEKITIRDEKVERARYSVRMFNAPEILEWFRTAGFSGARVMDERGGTFTVGSRRLVVLGTA